MQSPAGCTESGASVVNALSESLEVEVSRDGTLYKQTFSRGRGQSELTEEPLPWGSRRKTGTAVTFMPDIEIFEDFAYDFDVLRQRFKEMAYLNKGLEITFRSDWHGHENLWPNNEVTYYFEGGISSFVRSLNQKRAVVHADPIYVEKQVDNTIVEVAMQYNDSFTEFVHSFANCINTIDGGSHITGFRSALTRIINDYGRKQNLLKENESNLAGEDVREGLAAVISVKLTEPQFEGQTKTRSGQPGSQNAGRGRCRGGSAVLSRRQPAGRKAHHRQVPDRAASAGCGAKGARPHHSQERDGRRRTARQARRLLGEEPGVLRALPRGRRLGGRHGEDGARPQDAGYPAAVGQDSER